MWDCPSCRKTVDDGSDVCWNCGTSRAGTTDPHGTRDGPEQTHDADVVELCSAADAFEAHVIANALASAGLPVRVVGEVLQTAAGVPVGQPITPRVWVRSRDLSQARAILAGLQAGAVDGVSYPFVIERSVPAAQRLAIRYNPADPEDFRIDAIRSPGRCPGCSTHL
jgi:hypothetical protein